jgi:predicted transcriptional regulator
MEEQVAADELTNIGRLFTELAGNTRRLMLIELNEKRMRLSELAKRLNITVQSAHSNISRLIDIGLVTKISDGSMNLTTYGRAVLQQLPTFEFLSEHEEYFADHKFGDLPPKFSRGIGDLNDCSVVKGVVSVLQTWKIMYREAREYINSIIPQVPVDLIEPLADVINRGIGFSYILPENAIIPFGMSESVKKVSWNSLLAEGKVQRRMVKRITVATVLTDKSACLLFQDMKNEIDMNLMFYSDSIVFHEWCKDFFRYIWDSADLFDRRKLEREI